MVRYAILGMTFAFAAAIQPGPLQAYLVTQTLAHGRRGTFLASFAPIFSDVPIIALVLLVLTRLPSNWLLGMQAAGGIYLLYLARDAFKTFRARRQEEIPKGRSGRETLLKAIFVNLINPNPYLGWSLVMGPLLLKGWHEAPLNGIALLFGFYSVMVLGLFGTIMLASAAKKLGGKIYRFLLGLSVIALGCFGLYELASGLIGLIKP
jgi:threonine/homoserine/homoserine lactone efflux protein